MAAAATCDGFTQRIPTRIIHVTGITGAVLLVVAGLATGAWKVAPATLAAVTISVLLAGACWRFAGAGFGDVRLAALGGLGLGHARWDGVLSGVIAFSVLILGQGLWTLFRTHNRQATLPLGPALAVAFLIAAAT